MNSPNDLREEVALFRYGLIASIVREPPGTPGTYAKLREIAAKDYEIPGTTRRKIAAETARDWVRIYRKQGFEGLYPKARKDRGQSRKLSQEVVDALLEAKENNPDFTVKQVIVSVLDSLDLNPTLPASTVHRLLKNAGLMEQPQTKTNKDRRKFSFHFAGELWMSDVMHGIAVPNEKGRKHKTYLIAFLDDATRVIAHAAFSFSENTEAFLPVFKQALMRRGIPQRLYVDNGAAYRSRQLELVCAKLGSTLIHARPYMPQGKGKIERFFRTVRMQFMPQTKDVKSLSELNGRLWTWVEGEYHHAPHRGLDNQTPLECWAQKAAKVRIVEPHMDLDDMFLWEQKRKVKSDRTVSLDGILFEVPAELVGQTILLRYDPSWLGIITSRRLSLGVYDLKTRASLGQAKAVDLYANTKVKRDNAQNISFSKFHPKEA
jgi:putative transposase